MCSHRGLCVCKNLVSGRDGTDSWWCLPIYWVLLCRGAMTFIFLKTLFFQYFIAFHFFNRLLYTVLFLFFIGFLNIIQYSSSSAFFFIGVVVVVRCFSRLALTCCTDCSSLCNSTTWLDVAAWFYLFTTLIIIWDYQRTHYVHVLLWWTRFFCRHTSFYLFVSKGGDNKDSKAIYSTDGYYFVLLQEFQHANRCRSRVSRNALLCLSAPSCYGELKKRGK